MSDLPILDARDATVFERGHAPGAASLPEDEWDERAAELPPRGLEFRVVGDEPAHAARLVAALVARGHAGARVASARDHAERSETGAPRTLLWRASPWLEASLVALPARGTALDLATGSGRHALALAMHGLRTWGLDVLPDALLRARRLATETARVRAAARLPLAPCAFVRADATRALPFRDGWFDVVCAFRYLDRARFPDVARLLAPGGTLVWETFTVEQRRFGRPQRADFLLEPGELERLCEDAGLEVLAGGESVPPGGPALASIRARRGVP